MFKFGQVWRGGPRGDHVFIVLQSHKEIDAAYVRFLSGPHEGQERCLYLAIVKEECALIGNNYKPKALPEQRGCRKEDC